MKIFGGDRRCRWRFAWLYNQVQFPGADNGLHPAAYSHLAKNLVDVPFDRADGDCKPLSDIFIR